MAKAVETYYKTDGYVMWSIAPHVILTNSDFSHRAKVGQYGTPSVWWQMHGEVRLV